MLTFRSRGSDMIAVASLLGSRRTSMIVSERAPLAPSAFFFGRRSEPRMRIVCGLPGSVVASVFLPSFNSGFSSSAFTILSTSWKAATEVAAAAANTTRNPPISRRFQRPGRGMS
jgi:hypothetical protein